MAGGNPIRAGERGYTLMEMVVTLAMVALISVLVFDGLMGLYRQQERVGAATAQLDRRILAHAWLRQTIRGAVPDYPGGAGAFAGGPRGFSGLTISPLDASPGAPTRFAWSIQPAEGGAELIYSGADGADAPIQRVSEEAAFYYMDASRLWRSEWEGPAPPTMIALGLPDHPPVAATVARQTPLPDREIDALRSFQ